MDSWIPIKYEELEALLKDGVSKMTETQRMIWDLISIKPKKWTEVEYGDEGSGFWVVAIFGEKIIWYNDIEEGFNVSSYSKFGQIDEYGAEQDELQWTMNKLK